MPLSRPRIPPGITRRRVLAALAAVPFAGAVAAGSLGLRYWDRPPGEGLQVLSVDEHDFVDAVAEAAFPPGGTPALSGSEAKVGLFFDTFVATLPEATGRELKLLLQALDDLPMLGMNGAFRHMPLEARTKRLEAWLHHDQWLLRNAASALLVLVYEGYALHPEVAAVLAPQFRCGVGA